MFILPALIENYDKNHVQPVQKNGAPDVSAGRSPLKPHVENAGASTARTEYHDMQAADYRPKKDLLINKIKYVSIVYMLSLHFAIY